MITVNIIANISRCPQNGICIFQNKAGIVSACLKRKYNLVDYIRDIPDFPIEGILFRDSPPSWR